MLKALLTAFAAGGCVFMGMYASSGLKRRHDTARAMMQAITELNLSMQYSARPVSDLSKECGTAETRIFFDAFVRALEHKGVLEAWQSAMTYARENDAGFASLWEEELKILEEYARSLGGSDLRSQAKNAALLEKRMEPVVMKCMDAYARKGRIYKSMGILGGIAVTILLL